MQQKTSHWNTDLYTDKHAFVYGYGRSLIELLNPVKGERILDLGCGTGQLTNEIANYGVDVTGMDSSPEMIETAKRNFPLVNFQLGDATNFYFPEKFDAIFSNAALHWVTAHLKAIDSMYDNLKNSGRLVLEFGGNGNIHFITKELRQSLAQRGYGARSKLDLWYFPSVSEYATALESKGFEVTFAQLYDRPTELADKGTGIIDWLNMFGLPFFEGVTEKDSDDIKNEVQDKLRSALFRDEKWYADYRRIRIEAYKL